MMKNMRMAGAAGIFAVFAMTSAPALATSTTFSDIAENVVESIEQLPGLLSALAYMFGILLGVLGILKIKDHVENPGQTPLKDGAIRLAAGGGLFGLPIVYDAMLNTVGTGLGDVQAELQNVSFGS